jgi:hypothetical protein
MEMNEMRNITIVVLLSLAIPLALEAEPADSRDDRRAAAILLQAPGLRAEVLHRALHAYSEAADRDLVRRPRLTVVDYELPSFEKRLWVFDMATNELLFHEWVSHGMGHPRGSGGDLQKVLGFSNDEGTRMSSLGLYLTAETYYGRHGRSLRLDGLEVGNNDAARRRAIVVHGASYVSEAQAQLGRMGRSWGCPALRLEVAQEVIDAIADGSVLWVYYPDLEWLNSASFLRVNSKIVPDRNVDAVVTLGIAIPDPDWSDGRLGAYEQ